MNFFIPILNTKSEPQIICTINEKNSYLYNANLLILYIMTQTKKAKGYVVEVFHAHQNSLDPHVFKTYSDALKVLGSDLEAGKIYEVHSKHSTGAGVDGFTYILEDGKVAPQVFKEEIDADEARTKYLFEHPTRKDPGKVVALKTATKE